MNLSSPARLSGSHCGAGVDLSCFRSPMSDQEHDAPATRGSPPGFGVHYNVRSDEGRETSRACRESDFPPDDRLKKCKVKSHEDVPKHVFDRGRKRNLMNGCARHTALTRLCTPRRCGRPFSHKSMQTVLLASEIGSHMAWDGNTKDVVNDHFLKVSNTSKAFSYMDKLTIDNVFRTVILATLESSDNRALRYTYNQR
jgi:hypothetical protein